MTKIDRGMGSAEALVKDAPQNAMKTANSFKSCTAQPGGAPEF
jgi:hypothetical protein